MSGATDRLPRLLALVPYLLSHPGSRVPDVAAVFGVPERQLRDDLRLVWMCGLPGHTPGDLIDVEYAGDRVTVSNADTIARPLRLTADEALALVVALRTLADLPQATRSDAVDRARAKLETAVGDAAAGADAVTVALAAESDVVTTVREALDRGRAMELRYYVPGRDETTERVVDPMRLVLVEGHSYLEAWCRRVESVRLFRLDRVEGLSLLDEPAGVPATAQSRNLDDGLFQPSAHDTVVTLELGPVARWVADYYPIQSSEELPGGGLRVQLRTPDTRWLRRLALQLGAAGRVVDPPELAEAVRADARAALAGYAERQPE
jgi:proteasome accessory factor C